MTDELDDALHRCRALVAAGDIKSACRLLVGILEREPSCQEAQELLRNINSIGKQDASSDIPFILLSSAPRRDSEQYVRLIANLIGITAILVGVVFAVILIASRQPGQTEAHFISKWGNKYSTPWIGVLMGPAMLVLLGIGVIWWANSE